MNRILWRSWSKDCADFDFTKLSKSQFKHEWLNGHNHKPEKGDVWLTGNGYDNIVNHNIYKATIYAEPYIYLKSEYDNFENNNDWNKRFVYNPNLLKHKNTSILPIAGYWRCDERPSMVDKTHTFGMVLSKKPAPWHGTDIGYMRAKMVEKLSNKNFVYWGGGWAKSDKNYCGELYVSNDKFLDSQHLLSKCKFGLALDNSVINGYLTEKFWNCLNARCVPIYYGHESIKTKIDNNAFIYGYDFNSIDDLISYCESMSDKEYYKRRMSIEDTLDQDKKHSWEDLFLEVDNSIPT